MKILVKQLPILSKLAFSLVTRLLFKCQMNWIITSEWTQCPVLAFWEADLFFFKKLAGFMCVSYVLLSDAY